MIQITTSIEQSKRLIEAGVPKESADMITFYAESNDSVSAWSLSVLWQMVHELDNTYEFPTTLSANELIDTLVATIILRSKN